MSECDIYNSILHLCVQHIYTSCNILLLLLLLLLHGVQNVTGYQDKFLNHYKICRKRASASNSTTSTLPSNVVWVSTHLRPRKGKYGEKFKDIMHYNYEMNKFFASGRCGDITYVDVLQLTSSLQVPSLKHNLPALTYDWMHFTRTVNVLKAQLILHALDKV